MDEEMLRDAETMRPRPTGDALRRVTAACAELVELGKSIEALELKLKELKTKRYDMEMRALPELMDAAGTDIIGVPGEGVDVVVKPYYKAVLPKETAPQAAAWFDEHGHGDILATFVSVEFAKGEREHAIALTGMIREFFRGRNIQQHEPVIETSVHWRTLTSFVKEQVERGEVLPLDILGATVGRKAEVKKRKSR